jgi:MFS family permease
MSAPPDPASSLERNVRVFGITSFLNDTASEMAYWVLPAFIATLGGGPAQLGIIEGIAESVAAGAKFYSGLLADRFARRKPLIVSGYAIANIAKPLLALATAWWHILLIRFADRISKGVRGAPRDVLVSESVPPEKVGGAFGLLQSMDSAGAIVGPLFAWWLLDQLGFSIRSVFWFAAIPGLICVLIPLLFARETKHAVVSKVSELRANSHTLPPSFYALLAAVGLFSVGNSSDMFLVLRAKDVGIPAAQAPLLGLLFNLVYTVGSWPAGRLSDRLPRRYLAALGYAIFAAVYLVFGAAPSRNAIWAMMAFYGLYYALTAPVLKAMVVDFAPKEARGKAIGLFYLVSSITALLASLITGGLWKEFGAQVPFYLSAGLAALSAVLLLFIRPARS